MSLSCSCEDYCPEPGDVLWWGPNDYAPLQRKRSVRCKSCRELIPPGELAIEFPRVKVPDNEVELRIYGEDDPESGPPRASWFHCERCADLYLSIVELGFCVCPTDDMREVLREYHDFVKHPEVGR